MSKKVAKILFICTVFILIMGVTGIEANAAGGLSVSASATKVSGGGTFTVTVKAGSNYFVNDIKMNVSGGTIVSGLGVSSLDKGESATAKIKLTGDVCVVTVSSSDSVQYGPPPVEGTASASVTVKKKSSSTNNNNQSNTNNNNGNNNGTNTVINRKSKDNTLSMLKVSEGVLTPEFNSTKTEYSVSVHGNTEKIVLSAKANHSKATVVGIGEKVLVPGHNYFTIACTAENGSKKEYSIDVYVDETPIVWTTYNGKRLGVVRNQNEIGIPASFEKTTLALDGQSVEAYHSDQLNLKIIYLASESGDKDFYIYQEGVGITSVFRPISLLGRNLIVFDLTEEEQIRDNMVYSEVTIDGTSLYGWIYENPDFSNYIHILVMNEFGEKVVYQYEKTENSIQLYREYTETEELTDSVDAQLTWFPSEYYAYAIVGLLALVAILWITMIYFIASRKKRHEARKMKAQRKLEKKQRKEEKLLEKQKRKEEKMMK